MEQRVTAITLGVADLARARRFYEEGLGWRGGNDHKEVVFYQLPGMILSLFGRDSLAEDARLGAAGSGFSGITIAHNCRDRAGVDAVLAQAEAAGATILKSAEDAAWGGYGGYFADPDGHVWEVAWNPGWPLDADGTPRL